MTKFSMNKQVIFDFFARLRVFLMIPVIIYFGIIILRDIINGNSLTEIFIEVLPSFMIFIGAFFNHLVVFTNGFKMPVRVFMNESAAKFHEGPVHSYYTNPNEIRFQSLSDKYTIIFIVPRLGILRWRRKPIIRGFRFSIGDVYLITGIILMFLKGG